MKKVPTDWVNLITNSWMTPVMKKVGTGMLDDDVHLTLTQVANRIPTKQQRNAAID